MTGFDIACQMAGSCLCFRARKLSRLITRTYDEALRPLGLQATQVTLLSAVAMGKDQGLSMPRIAAALATDLSTLSRNLRPLERDGAISIGRAEDDRRVRIARITAKGEALLEAAWPKWQRAHEKVAALIGDAQTLREQVDLAIAGMAQGQPRK